MEALRAELRERFREAVVEVPPEGEALARGPALSSGWERVDALLPGGGIRAGESLGVDAEAGSGGIALLSSWAREASRQGEPVAVLDAGASCLPHPWVEPPDGEASIWVVMPEPPDLWPSVDILVRSGAFGLLILVDPPSPPPGVGHRLKRMLRRRQGRLLVLGSSPFPSARRLRLQMTGLRWTPSPVGDAPSERELSITSSERFEGARSETTVHRDDARTDRLRPTPRVADRGPSHGRGGRAREATKRRPE